MKSLTIHHSDLPDAIRQQPYAPSSAAALTAVICSAAKREGIATPFLLDKMDDRVTVREITGRTK